MLQSYKRFLTFLQNEVKKIELPKKTATTDGL